MVPLSSKAYVKGTYTIVMNDDDFLDGSSPFRRHYYPGVRDFSKAEPIVLEQGEEKTQIRFKALPMIPLQAVSGQVFRKDGTPFSAPGGQKPYIKVYRYEQGKEPKFFFIHSYILDWGKGKDGREVEMVDVSPDGKISLSLFEGNSYIVVVETIRGGIRSNAVWRRSISALNQRIRYESSLTGKGDAMKRRSLKCLMRGLKSRLTTLPNQPWVLSRLNEAKRSRNVIAHTNLLASDEITRLEMYLRDRIKQIG